MKYIFLNLKRFDVPVEYGGVNRLLNREIKAATARGLKVLYCIGEKSEEQDRWQEVLG